ncbi:glycosyltransferase involved in cell wall biosynthesis [Hymenobacter luteus]|uniref:Glycosyltransferase involved in cell wall biosynthesis n=2 Tax=Hymenobacter TaxID=89966 RepID=A0A7W9T073_9BACT|nr:glycosyltransferase family 2 protein [Hymenobacter latericoloratus]MBB4600616.1 glycosyltransferase involved in cell wall biosynthesis [Hymenobacter latericoloratus]MBB6059177.1 glycosyltransferase involved in cell wall biosynthesis [Hymenobacter luteus]
MASSVSQAPFFSIVVPCYNRADIIPETVQAILRQKYQDFELILVDDGSRDNLRDVVASIKDPRVHYYYKQNGERGAARNYGAQRAQGQYINFFDSDDEMYPNHLQVVRDFLDQHGLVEVVHTGYERLDEQNRVISEVCEFAGSTNEALLHDNPLACNTVFVRRDIALANPFEEDRRLASAEDWELWLRLASKYTFHPVRQKTFCLREHAGRSLNTIAPEAVRTRDELFAQLVSQNPDFSRRFPGQLSKFVADRYTFITLTMALSKTHRAETLQYLWKAVQHDPTVLWRRRFLASVKHLI